MCVMGVHSVCVCVCVCVGTGAPLSRFPVLQDCYGMPKVVSASLKTSATLTKNWVCVWIVSESVCVCVCVYIEFVSTCRVCVECVCDYSAPVVVPGVLDSGLLALCGPSRVLDDSSCECVCRNGLTESSCEPGWRLDPETCESGDPAQTTL